MWSLPMTRVFAETSRLPGDRPIVSAASAAAVTIQRPLLCRAISPTSPTLWVRLNADTTKFARSVRPWLYVVSGFSRTSLSIVQLQHHFREARVQNLRRLLPAGKRVVDRQHRVRIQHIVDVDAEVQPGPAIPEDLS